MYQIAILSASVRTGRRSHRVALFFRRFIEENKLAGVDLIDLKEYQFPVFDERLEYQKEPTQQMIDFSGRIKKADGVLIVTPEYNGGYPASLKNASDLLYDEWHRKPIGISTVSDGPFGGMQCITSIQYSFWKMRAWTIPALFPVPKVQDAFDEDGNPTEPKTMNKRARMYISELLYSIEAKHRMKDYIPISDRK